MLVITNNLGGICIFWTDFGLILFCLDILYRILRSSAPALDDNGEQGQDEASKSGPRPMRSPSPYGQRFPSPLLVGLPGEMTEVDDAIICLRVLLRAVVNDSGLLHALFQQ